MIFVTVGTQLPFDRLVRSVDDWASSGKHEVFAQIGPSPYRPKHMAWARFVEADECRRRFESASVIVAHAGMGSLITALELGKPIVVMPRRADLGEHRNDHQLATARRLVTQERAVVAFSEEELRGALDRIRDLRPAAACSSAASVRLVGALRHFINHGRGTASASTLGQLGGEDHDLSLPDVAI